MRLSSAPTSVLGERAVEARNRHPTNHEGTASIFTREGLICDLTILYATERVSAITLSTSIAFVALFALLHFDRSDLAPHHPAQAPG